MGQAVGAVGAFPPDGDLVGLVVAAGDSAGRYMGEKLIVAVPYGAFGNAAVGFVKQLKTPTHRVVPP